MTPQLLRPRGPATESGPTVPFAVWLAAQRDREDTVGDIARMLSRDLRVVYIGDCYPSLASLASRYYASEPTPAGSLTVQGQLRRAWHEWGLDRQQRAQERTRAARRGLDSRADNVYS